MYFLNRESKDDEMSVLFTSLIKLFETFKSQDRIIIPLLKTIEYLLENEKVNQWNNINQFSGQLFDLISEERKTSKSVHKTYVLPGVFTSLLNLNNEAISNQILGQLRILLTHKVPKVRKSTADKFYLFLMTNGESLYGEEKNEQICDQILDTDWLEIQENELTDIREIWKSLIIP